MTGESDLVDDFVERDNGPSAHGYHCVDGTCRRQADLHWIGSLNVVRETPIR